jgi:hypothetical protein
VSSNLLKFLGGGVVTYGWHFGEDHTDLGFASWTIIACGAIVFALGIFLRER